MKLFRILIRCMRDSLKSFVRNFSLSLASILCVTITLLLVSFTTIASVNINNTIESVENELNIIVYLNNDVTEDRIEELNAEFLAITDVIEVVYKSKEEWKIEMSETDESFENILNYLPENPLQDSFSLKVNDSTKINSIAEYVSQTNDVNTVKYGEGMVDSIISTFGTIQKTTIGIVVALIVVTVFLIGNTIKLTISSRRHEIEIMRLVGGSNMSIRLPFIFEGFLVGVIGSIIPVCVSVYGYIMLYDYFGGVLFTNLLPLIEPFDFILYIGMLLVILGATVGVIGSIRAVRKYLKV
ncbi:MAG: permease-like cell division protein FtsX [bacterium]